MNEYFNFILAKRKNKLCLAELISIPEEEQFLLIKINDVKGFYLFFSIILFKSKLLV